MTTDPSGYQAAAAPPAQTSNSLGIASLICGIVGIATAIIFALVGVVVGIVAVVLGARARQRPSSRGLATGGIATGAVAIVLGVLNSIFGALLLSGQL